MSSLKTSWPDFPLTYYAAHVFLNVCFLMSFDSIRPINNISFSSYNYIIELIIIFILLLSVKIPNAFVFKFTITTSLVPMCSFFNFYILKTYNSLYWISLKEYLYTGFVVSHFYKFLEHCTSFVLFAVIKHFFQDITELYWSFMSFIALVIYIVMLRKTSKMLKEHSCDCENII